MTDDPTREKLELADEIWKALVDQCAATKDKSAVKTLVTVRREDVVAALRASVQADALNRKQLAELAQNKMADLVGDRETGEIMGIGPVSYAIADAFLARVPADAKCICDIDHPTFKERGHHPLCPANVPADAAAQAACLELAAKHGFATGHGDTVADMIREFSAQIAALPPAQEKVECFDISEQSPRLIDDDKSEITVSLDGKELRGWSYKDDTERRAKMLCAREYVEGWCDGRGK
jgi:hypothetical protein